MTVTVNAYAKVNLSLDITGKRADGYHTLRSVMQSVSLMDTISVRSMAGGLKLLCSEGSICGEANLAFKAAERFFKAAGITPDAEITIKKGIPLAAGLGGGSVDAAAVLGVLNEGWESPLSDEELMEIALSLGADVPFCFKGGTKLAEGIGEVLTPLENLPDCLILIAKKGTKSSTGDMYRALDLKQNKKTSDIEVIKSGLKCGDVKATVKGFYNCFETVCGNESLEVKEKMYESGALYAGLSGAGPSVFGIFETEEKRQNAATVLKSFGCETFCCRPVKKGFEIV